MALILDTGPLLAAVDRSDRNHEACAGLLESTSEQLAIPAPILPEVDFWMCESVGFEAFLALLEEIDEGIFRVEELTPGDYGRVRELCRDYAQLRIGFVDAAVLAVTDDRCPQCDGPLLPGPRPLLGAVRAQLAAHPERRRAAGP